MQDHEMLGLLGPAHDDTTDDQRRIISSVVDALDQRWPGVDYTDERTAALNAALEIILGDSTPEAIAIEWASAAELTRLVHQRLTGAIIAMHLAGASEYRIADQIGVSRQTVRKALAKS